MNIHITLLVLHVFLSLGIIALVLLQKGAGASAGASFGGGGSGSAFGARGASNFLSKATAILATAFFVNTIVLASLASDKGNSDSVLDKLVAPAGEQVIDAPVADVPDAEVPAPDNSATESSPIGSANSDVPAPDSAVESSSADGSTGTDSENKNNNDDSSDISDGPALEEAHEKVIDSAPVIEKESSPPKN